MRLWRPGKCTEKREKRRAGSWAVLSIYVMFKSITLL